MLFSSFVTLTALAVTAAAVPAPVNHVLHEKRDQVLSGWVQRGRVHPDAEIPVRIGMTQSNLDRGHDLLMEVYGRLFHP